MNCPDCGSEAVSLEVSPDCSPLATLAAAVRRADEGDVLDVVRACWTCGWTETRELELRSIRVDRGDESVVERRRLLGAITDAAEELEPDALREVLTAVEQFGGGDR